eukprot:tig00000553_g2088.t1
MTAAGFLGPAVPPPQPRQLCGAVGDPSAAWSRRVARRAARAGEPDAQRRYRRRQGRILCEASHPEGGADWSEKPAAAATAYTHEGRSGGAFQAAAAIAATAISLATLCSSSPAPAFELSPSPSFAADTLYERFAERSLPEVELERAQAVELRYRALVDQAWRDLRDNFLEQQPRSFRSSLVSWRAVREKAHRRMDEAVEQLRARQERANVEPDESRGESGLPRYDRRAENILKEATYGAIREMTASLGDRYTRFYSPAELQAFLKGNGVHGANGVIGVGMGLGRGPQASGAGAPAVDGRGAAAQRAARAEKARGDALPPLVVTGLLADGPAEAAGVRVGDEILSIDGMPTTDLTTDEAALLLRGPRGTPVEISVARKNGPRASFSLVRRPAVRAPLVAALLPPEAGMGALTDHSIGYMRLRFVGSIGRREMPRVVQNLEAAGAEGFILDLRNNPGGIFEEGIEIARMWLDPEPGATILRTVDSHGFRTLFPVDSDAYAGGIPQPPEDSPSGAEGLLSPAPVLEVPAADGGRAAAGSDAPRLPHEAITQKPLVILTNAGTASASEIVAAALRDNGRAVLFGERTFGKGLIQYIFKLADGSGMKITVARYEAPSGAAVNGVGVAPDVPCGGPSLLGPDAFLAPDECLLAAIDTLDAAIDAMDADRAAQFALANASAAGEMP